jgi:hypothetical protein
VDGWPVGLSVIAVIVGSNGVTSLVEAFELAVTATGDWTAIALEGAIGVLLLHRAFALLSFHPVSWLVTVMAVTAHAGTVGDEIIRSHATWSSWVALNIAVGSVLYLFAPRYPISVRGRRSQSAVGQSLEPCWPQQSLAPRDQLPEPYSVSRSTWANSSAVN